MRANAGGSVFFAAINNSLYVGRRNTGVIAISDIDVTPAVVSFAPNRYVESFNEFRNQLTTFRGQHQAATDAKSVVDSLHELKRRPVNGCSPLLQDCPNPIRTRRSPPR